MGVNRKVECIGVVPDRQALPQIDGAFMAVIAFDFSTSRRADEQRRIRKVIRRIHRDQLTKTQRDVLMALVNTWFYHENGPKPYIHLGVKRIAKKVGCSEPTVKRALAVLRDLSVIKAIAYLQGGTGCATRYTVDTHRIIDLFSPHGIDVVSGELILFDCGYAVKNDLVSEAGNDLVSGYENDPLSIDRSDVVEKGTYLPVSESLIDHDDAPEWPSND